MQVGPHLTVSDLLFHLLIDIVKIKIILLDV